MSRRLHPPREIALVISAVSVAAFALVPTGAVARSVPSDVLLRPSVQAQLAAIRAEKESRTPAQLKIDSQLLFAEKRARHLPFPPHFPKLRLGVSADPAGRVRVDVRGRLTPRLLGDLRSTQGRITQHVPRQRALRVSVPLVNLEALAASRDVSFISPAEKPQLAVGSRTSEGDVTHRANSARAAFGIDGTGVTVGVMSDGIKSLARSQASRDLGPVTVLTGQAGPADGDEGTAMLEIVHDVAPGARLLFATAANSSASFAQNIRKLRAAGADIIVDDVYYFSETTFQDGPIAQAVNDVTADGALYFSSAGNSGNLDDGTSGVWEGDYAPADPADPDGTFADFRPGPEVQPMNPVAPVPWDDYAILQWADPVGAAADDYDLYLFDPTGTNVLAVSDNAQSGSGTPFEAVTVPGQASGGAGGLIAVQRYAGQPRYFDVNLAQGHWGSIGSWVAYPTAGRISGHAAAAGAFGVAAAPAHNPFDAGEPAGPYPGAYSGSSVTETFSSDGPRRMFFSADGTPYTPGNFSSTGGQVRAKPDLTAADGVATSVPGFRPFFGTSAAAPHAAAIAALLLDARPKAAPSLVRAALTSTAIDIEAPGIDRNSGAGIVNALAAANYLGSPSVLTNRAPASVSYYGLATIRATLIDGRTRAALAGQRLTLYRRANSAKPWSAVKTVTTSSAGQASAVLRMTANAQFRWRYGGSGGHAATNSASRAVAVKQVVSIYRTARSIRSGSTVTFYGTVRPTGSGQRVYLQRYVNHRWVTKSSATIKYQRLPNGTRRSGYVLPRRLITRGTYTFRVYKSATSTLASGWSGARAVTVT